VRHQVGDDQRLRRIGQGGGRSAQFDVSYA